MELPKSIYGSSKLGVFSVTFSDFHEVSSWKCRHATKSWESGHNQRCVILSYNKHYDESQTLITHFCIKYFQEFLGFGVFQKCFPYSDTFITVQGRGQTDLVKYRYGSSNIGVFSMNFMKCRHATKSWESGHMKRCVILSYNKFISQLMACKFSFNIQTRAKQCMLYPKMTHLCL